MCVVKIHTWSSKLPHPKGSSETHFQTAFCYFAKQIFPPPSPQTSSEPVNSPCFNNFLKQTMSGIYLPRLFPPHIAERGLLYFQQGKVRDVQKTSAGRYRAEVCGSENYSVWLKLDSDLYIKDGAVIALMVGRASIWRRCGMRCVLKLRITIRQNLTRSSLKRAAIRIGSSSPKSFPEPDIMITTKPPIWGSASCSLYSNDRGRLKHPYGIFQTAFCSGVKYLIHQARCYCFHFIRCIVYWLIWSHYVPLC